MQIIYKNDPDSVAFNFTLRQSEGRNSANYEFYNKNSTSNEKFDKYLEKKDKKMAVFHRTNNRLVRHGKSSQLEGVLVLQTLIRYDH